MAYFLIIPISFRILIYFTMQGGSLPFIFLKDFYNWIFTLFVICGIFYTIPVFLVMLVHARILPMRFLRGRNKIVVYVILLLLFWVFGPDPTPITGLIMLAPFIAVMETATFFAGRIDQARKKRKEESELGKSGGFGFISTKSCKFCRSPVPEGSSFCRQCKKSLI